MQVRWEEETQGAWRKTVLCGEWGAGWAVQGWAERVGQARTDLGRAAQGKAG